jgi:hypothetical protein
MPSSSETGHAKNVANFQDLISFCTAYGASYNPGKASLKLAELDKKRTNAIEALAAVNSSLPASINAINQREIIFSPLNKLITRVVNAAAASDVSTQLIADVKTTARKLQGKRATAKKPTVVDDPATPADESQKSNSASQMSFDQRIENMDKLIQLLTAQPGYSPNEPELSVAGLTNLLTDMKAANTTAINAYTPVSNARIKRNDELYNPQTGLVAAAAGVKLYVKSVYGASSPQFKQVSKIIFTQFKP